MREHESHGHLNRDKQPLQAVAPRPLRHGCFGGAPAADWRARRPERRGEAKDDSAQQRHAEGEQQHAGIHGNFAGARKRSRQQPDDRPGPEESEEKS